MAAIPYRFKSPRTNHVVYVSEEDEPGDGIAFLVEMATDPQTVAVFGTGFVFLVAVALTYLRWRPAWRDVAAFRSALASYTDLLPWLLRLGFGLPLVGAGIMGEFFNPALTPPLLPEVIRVGQLVAGFALLFGFATRAIAALTLGVYLVSLPFVPTLIISPEWAFGLFVIVLLGSGRPSADQVIERVAATQGTLIGRLDPVHVYAPNLRAAVTPVRSYVPTILRVGLGTTFIALGVLEKLLAPNMAAAVAAEYGLTAVPIPVEYWVLGAGLTEVLLGTAILVGLFTRAATLVALVMFVAALFVIPDDPVLAHVGLFSMISALLITGAGPVSVDRWVTARR